jgi:hypothetical protein
MTDEEIEKMVDEFLEEEFKEAIEELTDVDDSGNIEPPELKQERSPEPSLIR